jgi:uncharacterized protein
MRPVSGRVKLGVNELFESDPIEGETYQLEHDTIDLEPLARDAIGLELPLAPLCRPDCAGLCGQCGADRNEIACDCVMDDTDPRWDALAGLRFADETVPEPGVPEPWVPEPGVAETLAPESHH